ncbi:hypothetical protein L210DRAFT_1002698 [Boletus edulis BED1]|uniref:Uncharacterized protein n=1 Tax=Boletus edulis BED1 TaxID=1328754 RepID=A0AAD4BYZ9_BOLED|nr:hypothetical protein L210DRAFT_1002698 [Boletus edulis BED1]
MSSKLTPSGISPRSPRSEPSVHQIPTPGTENKRPPRYEPLELNFWSIRAASLFMILLGIVLQIGLFLSETRNGFPVPTEKVLSLVSTHFLASFFSSLFAPYVTLSQGGAPASRSILLDYVSLPISDTKCLLSNKLNTIYHSWIYRHSLITTSGLIGLSVILLQPLAGSLLQVRKVPHLSDSTALLMGTIGLSPNIDNLNGFLASAGVSVSRRGGANLLILAVYNNQVDPPFVHDDWAAGEFQAQPGAYLNGTLAVTTTAIQTGLNCASPSSLNLTTNADGSHIALATFSDGCSASNVSNPSGGIEQFSVFNVNSCGASGLDVKFQPVVFWFYPNSSSPQVASVYCSPTMNVFTVETSMNLTTASLGDCTIIEPVQSTNNVTGSPQYGRPYNGVVFGSVQDPYVSSRALAVNLVLPDAIYRYASRQPGGPLSVFQDPYGFLNATENIYTRYLSIAAQINYFLTGNSTTPAQLTTETPRLFIQTLPAFILSSLMIAIGFVGFGVHYLHRRARRRLWLTSPPGSIGAIVSLTSRSGFGQFLLPYDDERKMQERLSGLTFCIDERTGAIVAEEDFGAVESSDEVALLARQRSYGTESWTDKL